MAEDPDDWEKKEGRWTRTSSGTEAADSESTRYFELPSGEVVRGPPPEGVPAEEVPPPEQTEAAEEAEKESPASRLGGLFGGGGEETEEADEPPEAPTPEHARAADEPEETSRGLPVAAIVVVLLLLAVIGLVGAAFLDIADPLGIGPFLEVGDTDGGTTGGTTNGGGGDGGTGPPGGNQTSTAPEFIYPVNWTTTSNTVSESSESELSQGNSTTVEVPIDRFNVTGARLHVTWDDSGDQTGALPTSSSNDTMKATLQAPDGTSDTVEVQGPGGGTGHLNVTLALSALPSTPTQVKGNTTAEADAEVTARRPPVTATAGTWTVTLELVQANPCQQVQDQQGPDCTSSWNFDLEYIWYGHSLGTPSPNPDAS